MIVYTITMAINNGFEFSKEAMIIDIVTICFVCMLYSLIYLLYSNATSRKIKKIEFILNMIESKNRQV